MPGLARFGEKKLNFKVLGLIFGFILARWLLEPTCTFSATTSSSLFFSSALRNRFFFILLEHSSLELIVVMEDGGNVLGDRSSNSASSSLLTRSGTMNLVGVAAQEEAAAVEPFCFWCFDCGRPCYASGGKNGLLVARRTLVESEDVRLNGGSFIDEDEDAEQENYCQLARGYSCNENLAVLQVPQDVDYILAATTALAELKSSSAVVDAAPPAKKPKKKNIAPLVVAKKLVTNARMKAFLRSYLKADLTADEKLLSVVEKLELLLN